MMCSVQDGVYLPWRRASSKTVRPTQTVSSDLKVLFRATPAATRKTPYRPDNVDTRSPQHRRTHGTARLKQGQSPFQLASGVRGG
eukprot:9468039-Pyramimonas_sp.AAC.1